MSGDGRVHPYIVRLAAHYSSRRTEFDFQPDDDHCTVFADPAGHAFCLSTWGEPS